MHSHQILHTFTMIVFVLVNLINVAAHSPKSNKTFSASIQQDDRSLKVTSSNSSERRVALVIGNGAYQQGSLANALNDAADIAATLRSIGFEVLYGVNQNRAQMRSLIREFGRKISNGGVGLFYFAGHGIQVSNRNYLIPIGADIFKETEVEGESIDVGFVLAQMEDAHNRLNILILDACRNNPFARSYRSDSRGLASMTAPTGTLIEYATKENSVASDGEGRNGLFTQELLVNIKTPGLTVGQVFNRTRTSVYSKSSGKQVPFEANMIVGEDFYFIPPTNAGPTPFTGRVRTKSVGDWLKQAEISIQRRDSDSAIQATEEALHLDPQNGVAHWLSGEAHSIKGNSNKVIQERDEVLQLILSPQTAEDYCARGWAYIKKKDYDKAIADNTEAIRLDPNCFLAYINRGIAYFNKNDLDQAQTDFTKAAPLAPGSAISYYYLGVIFYNKKDLNASVESYTEAIRRDSKYMEAYCGRATSFIAVKDFDSGLADATEAIRLDPKDSLSHYTRGQIYYHKKDYQNAIKDLDNAIRLNPKFIYAYTQRAYTYRALNRDDLADADEKMATSLKNAN